MSVLNEYEAGRVREIMLWKAERPSLLLESYQGLVRPFSKLLTRVVPKHLAEKALVGVEARIEAHDSIGDILKAGGVSQVRDLLGRSLEECDRLSGMVSTRAEHLALLEGVVPALGGVLVPGVGGTLASTVDIPFLLEASLRAIRRIGHCYGFALDSEADRRFVLTILDIANEQSPAGAEEARRRLWSPDGPARVEGIEQAVVDDLPLESVPYLGDAANLILDNAFVRRADVTAQRVFQERWLRENGKVESIPPSPMSHRRSSIEGAAWLAADFAYVGAYGVAFGVTFPSALAGSFFESVAPDSVRRGLSDGAGAASRDSRRMLERLGLPEESSPQGAPGLATA